MIIDSRNLPTDYFEGLCISTDTKPSDVAAGSLVLELDTGDMYYYDGTTWAKVGG